MLAKKIIDNTGKITDKDLLLLNRLLDGEQKESAFCELMQRYQERIYWHIRRMLVSHDDTDDVLQNVFIKIWQNIEKFKGNSSLFTWIYRIATNETFTFLKNEKKREIHTEDYEFLAGKLQDDRYFTGDEIQRRLQHAILTLPEKQRLVFNMKYYDDLKYEEIASITSTSVGALKASYHHAVTKIRKNLEID